MAKVYRQDETPTRISRRSAIELLFGLSVAFGLGCGKDDAPAPAFVLPAQSPRGEVPERSVYADNVDALVDVLVPAERDAKGRLVAAGARETGASDVLGVEDFVALAATQGLVTSLSDEAIERLGATGRGLRVLLDAELDVLASRRRPRTAFRDLPRAEQESVVAEAFDDPAHRPALLLVRAAAFVAYLGGGRSDAGLRALGFPPFEDFENGIAVSGYPRTRSGRRVDVTKEDLRALAAKGDLDDYTYDREPRMTPGDPLATALDAGGDLP